MQGAKWNAAIVNLTNLTTAAKSGKRAAYMRTMPGKSAKPSKPKSLPRREPAGYSFNNRRVLKWNIKCHAKPMPQKGVKKPSKREVYPTENNSYKSVVLQLIEGSDRSPHKFADVASAIKFLQSYGKVVRSRVYKALKLGKVYHQYPDGDEPGKPYQTKPARDSERTAGGKPRGGRSAGRPKSSKSAKARRAAANPSMLVSSRSPHSSADFKYSAREAASELAAMGRSRQSITNQPAGTSLWDSRTQHLSRRDLVLRECSFIDV